MTSVKSPFALELFCIFSLFFQEKLLALIF